MSGLVGQVGSRSGVINTTELEYEEGTFTISHSATSGSATVNSSYDTGYYVRVGNLVHIQANINLSGGSGSGQLQITLPFVNGTSADESQVSAGAIATYSVNYVSGSYGVWEISGDGATFVSLMTAGDDTTWGNFYFASGDYYLFSIQYRTQ